MSGMTLFLMLVVLYLCIVYLIPVKRGGESALGWMILIAVQAGTFFLVTYVFAPTGSMKLIMQIALIAINIIPCLVVSTLFGQTGMQTKEVATAYVNAEEINVPSPTAMSVGYGSSSFGAGALDTSLPDLNVGDLPDISGLPKREETPQTAAPMTSLEATGDMGVGVGDVLASTAAPLPQSADDIPATFEASSVAPLGTTQSDDDMNEEMMFINIEHLINEGKTDEAVRALRMIAFFGDNLDSMQKAKDMLAKLNV